MPLMWARFTSHLYVRIWLAVVATVLVLTFLVGAAWQFTRDPPQLPIREVLVHNTAGEVIGTAQTKPDRKLGEDLEFDVVTKDGQTLNLLLPRPKRPPGNPWMRPPFGFGFGWMLGLVGFAVALGAYPIMRRLTLRLEALQRGVERWGAGDLSARVNADGTDEVAFLASRFNHAAERIETLMALHKSLLANASHELRSPLARIRMGLALVVQAGAASSAERGQRQEIARSIDELDQLIDEILLASRLDLPDAEEGAALGPVEEVDLIGLAAEECARTGADLDVAPGTAPLLVQGHARLLRRLLRNLLENARRYGQPLGAAASGAAVATEVRLLLSQGGSGLSRVAVVAVEDRGSGVPTDLRERIFEPFYRLPGASEREGGVGLGLSLVKTIAERHGGRVRCEAREGGGARFVVELAL